MERCSFDTRAFMGGKRRYRNTFQSSLQELLDPRWVLCEEVSSSPSPGRIPFPGGLVTLSKVLMADLYRKEAADHGSVSRLSAVTMTFPKERHSAFPHTDPKEHKHHGNQLLA